MRVSYPVHTLTDQTEILSSLLARHRREGHAFSLWREPGSSEKKLLVCTKGVLELDELLLEEITPGFAFAPFDSAKMKLYLTADVVYHFHDHPSLENQFTAEELLELKKELHLSRKGAIHFPVSVSTSPTEKDSFIDLVNQSIQFIKNGQAEKLVPSRTRSFQLKEALDVVDTFDQLCIRYPNAMVSLVSIPDVGTWFGATPELLLSIDAAKCFRTTALAGTQVHDPSIDPREVKWTQKEIEEQALVSRYIINCFKRIRLRDFKEHGPKTFVAGNLIHLKTDFEADMVGTGFPNLGSQMLSLLHPTSAVCGTPLEATRQFLLEQEGYDRKFYSGFLGPVNIDNEIHLFVNLRCMQLDHDSVILYAGAGVTIDSMAEKEWQETEMKMDTLLRVITS